MAGQALWKWLRLVSIFVSGRWCIIAMLWCEIVDAMCTYSERCSYYDKARRWDQVHVFVLKPCENPNVTQWVVFAVEAKRPTALFHWIRDSVTSSWSKVYRPPYAALRGRCIQTCSSILGCEFELAHGSTTPWLSAYRQGYERLTGERRAFILRLHSRSHYCN